MNSFKQTLFGFVNSKNTKRTTTQAKVKPEGDLAVCQALYYWHFVKDKATNFIQKELVYRVFRFRFIPNRIVNHQ